MNLKIDTELSLALEIPEEEREKSDDLNTGYEKGDFWELIIRFSGSITSEVIELGGTIKELLGGYGLVRIPEQNIDRLSELTKVLFIEKPRKLQYEIEYSKIISCINSSGYSEGGSGVLVGVIDSGIDYLHPEFIDEDGNTRIAVIYDEEKQRVITREEIDNAIREEDNSLIKDISGHGTSVAGIAAGNSGVASGSEIVFVKLGEDELFNTARLMEGVDFCVKYGISVGKPMVINISIGNNYGAHDGTSLLETYLDYVSTLWKISIIVGSGNEANKRIHKSLKLSYEVEDIELIIGPFESSISLQIWKKSWDSFSQGILLPNNSRIDISGNSGTTIYESKNEVIYVYKGISTPYSIDDEILIVITAKENYIESGSWRFIFQPKRIKDGTVDIWLAGMIGGGMETGFISSEPESTLTIPSTAYKVITVGAYNGRTMSYADFSGRGNTKNLVVVKPEIVAPGVDILAPIPEGRYARRTGTSFAAPFVTGSAAILMEWGIVKGNDLFMYGERLKAKLIDGARPLSGFREYPNELVGWGTLCLK